MVLANEISQSTFHWHHFRSKKHFRCSDDLEHALHILAVSVANRIHLFFEGIAVATDGLENEMGNCSNYTQWICVSAFFLSECNWWLMSFNLSNASNNKYNSVLCTPTSQETIPLKTEMKSTHYLMSSIFTQYSSIDINESVLLYEN